MFLLSVHMYIYIYRESFLYQACIHVLKVKSPITRYVKSCVPVISTSKNLFKEFVQRKILRTVRIMCECGKVRTSKTPNTDTFHAVLLIGPVSLIGCTEAERAAFGNRRAKTSFRSTMTD